MKGTIVGFGLSMGLLLVALCVAPPAGLSTGRLPDTVSHPRRRGALVRRGRSGDRDGGPAGGRDPRAGNRERPTGVRHLRKQRLLLPDRRLWYLCGTATDQDTPAAHALSCSDGRATISRRIMAGYILVTGLVSVMVTDAAATVICAGLAAGMLRAIGNPEPGTSRMAKGLMIAIPFAALTGGISTPASNAINIIAIEMLRTYTGKEICFLEWACVGVPVALLSTLFLAWWMPRFFEAGGHERRTVARPGRDGCGRRTVDDQGPEVPGNTGLPRRGLGLRLLHPGHQ